jgi:hypothetical protein
MMPYSVPTVENALMYPNPRHLIFTSTFVSVNNRAGYGSKHGRMVI